MAQLNIEQRRVAALLDKKVDELFEQIVLTCHDEGIVDPEEQADIAEQLGIDPDAFYNWVTDVPDGVPA